MRILELSWEYPPHVVGGLGSHVSALVPALAALGAAVTIVTPQLQGGASFEQTGSVRVHRVDVEVQHDNWFARVQSVNEQLAAAVEQLFGDELPFDVIHGHDWLIAAAAERLKHRYQVPLVATFHGTERGRGRGAIGNEVSEAISHTEWELAYEAWRVITVSQSMAGELSSFFELPADKIDVIHNGVDTAPYDALNLDDLREFRRTYAPSGERLVLSIGRLVYEKGAHLLIEAAPAVLSRVPDCIFVLAGQGTMLDVLRDRAAALGISARCTFAGFVGDAERDALYCVADCAVFPSLYEPFGIVALEAMAARCPVVASKVGGLAEVLTDGETGLTVPPMAVEPLATAIALTLEDAPAARARAARAYDEVRRRFSWSAIAAQTLAVMERVADERKRTAW